MKELTNLFNKICLPIVIIGAINYGLIGVLGLDLLGYLNSSFLVQAVQIIIGISGVGVALGLFNGKK